MNIMISISTFSVFYCLAFALPNLTACLGLALSLAAFGLSCLLMWYQKKKKKYDANIKESSVPVRQVARSCRSCFPNAKCNCKSYPVVMLYAVEIKHPHPPYLVLFLSYYCRLLAPLWGTFAVNLHLHRFQSVSHFHQMAQLPA